MLALSIESHVFVILLILHLYHLVPTTDLERFCIGTSKLPAGALPFACEYEIEILPLVEERIASAHKTRKVATTMHMAANIMIK
jgi:hypothetical protein